jgi:hypothetical protein
MVRFDIGLPHTQNSYGIMRPVVFAQNHATAESFEEPVRVLRPSDHLVFLLRANADTGRETDNVIPRHA